MKLRNLLILASLCLLPTACADGMAEGDIPPITEAEPPAVQPVPQEPVPTPEAVPTPDPDDDNDHPQFFPSGEIQVQKKPDWQLAPASYQYPSLPD
ncbi:hypothetical protein F9K50_06045 [bacterium]|nr:MAG: hypothetical protein F9K50_06045 [bacterium]